MVEIRFDVCPSYDLEKYHKLYHNPRENPYPGKTQSHYNGVQSFFDARLYSLKELKEANILKVPTFKMSTPSSSVLHQCPE